MDFSSRKALKNLVEELRDSFHMDDEQFKDLHHRENLRNGITAHLKYLETGSILLGAHQQLARRLHACLGYLKRGLRWPEAIRLAKRDFPR